MGRFGRRSGYSESFAEAIKGAKTILWNGPAGVFEFDNFTAGSRAIAEAIAEATKTVHSHSSVVVIP